MSPTSQSLSLRLRWGVRRTWALAFDSVKLGQVLVAFVETITNIRRNLSVGMAMRERNIRVEEARVHCEMQPWVGSCTSIVILNYSS